VDHEAVVVPEDHQIAVQTGDRGNDAKIHRGQMSLECAVSSARKTCR
jgi:hypothetical protein